MDDPERPVPDRAAVDEAPGLLPSGPGQRPCRDDRVDGLPDAVLRPASRGRGLHRLRRGLDRAVPGPSHAPRGHADRRDPPPRERDGGLRLAELEREPAQVLPGSAASPRGGEGPEGDAEDAPPEPGDRPHRHLRLRRPDGSLDQLAHDGRDLRHRRAPPTAGQRLGRARAPGGPAGDGALLRRPPLSRGPVRPTVPGRRPEDRRNPLGPRARSDPAGRQRGSHPARGHGPGRHHPEARRRRERRPAREARARLPARGDGDARRRRRP